MIKNKQQGEERIIAKQFLSEYNKINQNPLKFLELGNPDKKEPDILCSGCFSIEITSTYDNQEQAKRIGEEKKGINNPYLRSNIAILTYENIVNSIYTKLQKLEKGLYNGVESSHPQIILLCDCRSPLFKEQDARRILQEYQNNSFKQDNYFDKYFYETWLLWWEGGNDYRILKLE